MTTNYERIIRENLTCAYKDGEKRLEETLPARQESMMKCSQSSVPKMPKVKTLIYGGLHTLDRFLRSTHGYLA